MKPNRRIVSVFAFSVALAGAVPGFAQKGGGLGVGLGGQTNIGVGAGAGANSGTGAGVQAGGAKVGVGTNADVHTKTSAGPEVKLPTQSATDIAPAIEANHELTTRVQSMLPNGTSISSAAAGFRNQGQFLAALNASHNLDIPFDQLKMRMTGSSSMSLGSAIKASKPGITGQQAKEEAKKAESQAKVDASAKTKASAAASTNATNE